MSKYKAKHPDAKNADHPFRAFYVVWPEPGYTYYQRVPERLACVKGFDLEDCRKALKLPDLQATVRKAIKRRLKKLEADA